MRKSEEKEFRNVREEKEKKEKEREKERVEEFEQEKPLYMGDDRIGRDVLSEESDNNETEVSLHLGVVGHMFEKRTAAPDFADPFKQTLSHAPIRKTEEKEKGKDEKEKTKDEKEKVKEDVKEKGTGRERGRRARDLYRDAAEFTASALANLIWGRTAHHMERFSPDCLLFNVHLLKFFLS